MKLWTDARHLDFLSRLSQPSTSSAVPLPSPLLQLLESQIHPVLTDSFTCWWEKPGLLGLIFLPRSAAANGDELRDLSAEGAGPIPILSPASVSLQFFCLLSCRLFWRIIFLLFFFLVFGPQELEPTEIRDVLRCECSDLSFSHPLPSLYLR